MGNAPRDDDPSTSQPLTEMEIAADLDALVQIRQARAEATERHRAIVDLWETSRPPIGPVLASARKAAGMTQAEVAEQLGVTQPTVASAERQSSVRLSTLCHFLYAIGAEQPYLITTVNGTEIEIPL